MSVDQLQQPQQQNMGAHSNQWTNFQISISLILWKTKTILNFLLRVAYPELYILFFQVYSALYILSIRALNLETEPIQVDFIRD